MGLLSDRIGRKRAMIIGFTLSNFGVLGLTLARSETVMLVMALFWGASWQLYVLSQAPFMMQASDDRTRDVLFSLSYGRGPAGQHVRQPPVRLSARAVQPLPGHSRQPWLYQAVLLTSVITSFAVLIALAFVQEPKAACAPCRHRSAAGQRPVPLEGAGTPADPETGPAQPGHRLRCGHAGPLLQCLLRRALRHERCEPGPALQHWFAAHRLGLHHRAAPGRQPGRQGAHGGARPRPSA